MRTLVSVSRKSPCTRAQDGVYENGHQSAHTAQHRRNRDSDRKAARPIDFAAGKPADKRRQFDGKRLSAVVSYLVTCEKRR